MPTTPGCQLLFFLILLHTEPLGSVSLNLRKPPDSLDLDFVLDNPCPDGGSFSYWNRFPGIPNTSSSLICVSEATVQFCFAGWESPKAIPSLNLVLSCHLLLPSPISLLCPDCSVWRTLISYEWMNSDRTHLAA